MKIDNRLILIALLLVIVTTILYLSASFVAISFNPFEWDKPLRATMILIDLVFLVFCTDQYYR